jgi:hypothetical protein
MNLASKSVICSLGYAKFKIAANTIICHMALTMNSVSQDKVHYISGVFFYHWLKMYCEILNKT